MSAVSMVAKVNNVYRVMYHRGDKLRAAFKNCKRGSLTACWGKTEDMDARIQNKWSESFMCY